MTTRHKVFISYHHDNDEEKKDELLKLNQVHDIFIDGSVDTGDIDDNLPDETIRQKIRDEYLRDTTVTILLVGTETKNRKHIDWEIYSSMIDGSKNKKSGILVIQLPSASSGYYTAAHGEREKEKIYPKTTTWTNINTRTEFEARYPYLPDRIIDNLLKSESKISVTTWDKIDESSLRLLIDLTSNEKDKCEYDMSRPMRRRNS
jgi:hypothetical protein